MWARNCLVFCRMCLVETRRNGRHGRLERASPDLIGLNISPGSPDATHISTFLRCRREEIGGSLGDIASEIPCAFVDATRHPPHRRIRAATRFKSAGRSVGLAGSVEQSGAIAHQSAPGRQVFAARTDIDVALAVTIEVVSREGPVGSLGFVEHRGMRLDALLIDQSVEHLSKSVPFCALRFPILRSGTNRPFVISSIKYCVPSQGVPSPILLRITRCGSPFTAEKEHR